MSPETVNTIKEALAPIAAKIGQGAEYGWEVVVRQQYINGITNLIWAFLFLVIAVVFGILSSYCWKWKKENEFSDWEIGGVLFAVIALVATVVMFMGITDGVQHLLNPAYYALDFFIHLGTPTQ